MRHTRRNLLASVLLATTTALVSLVAAVQTVGASPLGQRAAVSAYRLVASDGGVFTFGGAGYYGSMGGKALNRPIVGMASTPDNAGYWLVASDGGIFSFGDAGFHGSTGNIALNRPVVGMAPTATGQGYWLVASDGGVFSFGDAQFHGSTGNIALNQPIVGMSSTPDGRGYWLVASDGGIFAFGDAGYHGSLGGVPQSRPIISITRTLDGRGYWITNNNGAVTAFGDATYWGSAPQSLYRPIVGADLSTGDGSFSGSSYPSGSYGYDISNYQCGNLPPPPHTVEIVQVVGASMGAVNPCLGTQARSAGAGLNLYMFMTYGTAPVSSDPGCAGTESPTACQYGFSTALDAYGKAQAAGINTQVAWWLDVENPDPQQRLPAWSGDLASNAALVQGAIDGLRYEGINSAGIYASPGVWNSIVGNYQPAVPYWAAHWGITPSVTCTSVRSQFSYARLPTGPVQVVQYSSPTVPLPLGGMNISFDNDYAC